MRAAKQLRLHLRTWGGKRRGAGRKPKGARPLVAHRPRDPLRAGWAVHVTMRMREHVWKLRSRRCFDVLERCLVAGKERFGCRVVHFSVQGNHIHLVVEAPDNRSLARGMQGLAVRIARALNRLMRRRGRVFADHFHSRVVRTPNEAAHAIAYVLANFAKHAAQWGEHVDARSVDRYSSAFVRATGPPPVVAPRTWLLTIGWRRARARGSIAAAIMDSRGFAPGLPSTQRRTRQAFREP
jgi:putative transposase